MKDQFNSQSLAKLTKAELQALIASYTGQLHGANDEQVRSNIQSKIVAARIALSLK